MPSGYPPKRRRRGSGDHADDTDSEREDQLEDGQRAIQKGSETLYIPQSVVGERLVGKKLEYHIRWKKWHDLSWEKQMVVCRLARGETHPWSRHGRRPSTPAASSLTFACSLSSGHGAMAFQLVPS